MKSDRLVLPIAATVLVSAAACMGIFTCFSGPKPFVFWAFLSVLLAFVSRVIPSLRINRGKCVIALGLDASILTLAIFSFGFTLSEIFIELFDLFVLGRRYICLIYLLAGILVSGPLVFSGNRRSISRRILITLAAGSVFLALCVYFITVFYLFPSDSFISLRDGATIVLNIDGRGMWVFRENRALGNLSFSVLLLVMSLIVSLPIVQKARVRDSKQTVHRAVFRS